MTAIKNTSNVAHAFSTQPELTDPPKKKPFIRKPEKIKIGPQVFFPNIGYNPMAGSSKGVNTIGLGANFAASADFGNFRLNGTIGINYLFDGYPSPDRVLVRYYGENHPIAGYQFKEENLTTYTTISRLDIASLGFDIPIKGWSVGLGAVLGFNVSNSKVTKELINYQRWSQVNDCENCIDVDDIRLSALQLGEEDIGDDKGVVLSLRPEIAYDFELVRLALSYTTPIAGKPSTRYASLSATVWMNE